jgi:ABC-2 type transport system permease protein
MLWKIVFAHEWLLLRRNPLLLAGLGFLLLCGAYGLYAGHHFAQAQRAVLQELEAGQATRLARHLARAQADTSTAQGRRDRRWVHDAVVSDRELAQVVAQPLPPLVGLAIGQRDVYPAYYPCRPWDDAYDTNATELRNPDQLLAGNFDLAFVLLYLVPLFAIAYAHNVLAEEQAQHTYRLLQVQAGSVRAVVGYKLLFRLGVVLAVVLGLSIAGFWLNAVPLAPAAPWLGWLLVSTLYVAAWFAAIYALAARARSAGAAALSLLGAWVLVVVLAPAGLNYALQRQQTDPEALRLVSLGRDQRTNPWYRPLPAIRQAFYQVAPQFSSARYATRDTSELRFLAYTELQHQQKDSVGTAQAREQVHLYEQTQQYNLLNPAYAAQQALNRLTHSELPDHQAFVQAVRRYQRQRRYFSFGYDLSKQPFGPAQLTQFPVFAYQPATSLAVAGRGLWVLLAWGLGLAALGYYQLGRRAAA